MMMLNSIYILCVFGLWWVHCDDSAFQRSKHEGVSIIRDNVPKDRRKYFPKNPMSLKDADGILAILGLTNKPLPYPPAIPFKGYWRGWLPFFKKKEDLYCVSKESPPESPTSNKIIRQLTKAQRGSVRQFMEGRLGTREFVIFYAWVPALLAGLGGIAILTSIVVCFSASASCRGCSRRLCLRKRGKIHYPTPVTHLSRNRQWFIFFVYIVGFCVMCTVGIIATSYSSYDAVHNLTVASGRTLCNLKQIGLELGFGSKAEENVVKPLGDDIGGVSNDDVSASRLWKGFEKLIITLYNLLQGTNATRSTRLGLMQKRQSLIKFIRQSSGSTIFSTNKFLGFIKRVNLYLNTLESKHTIGIDELTVKMEAAAKELDKFSSYSTGLLFQSSQVYEEITARINHNANFFHGRITKTSNNIMDIVQKASKATPFVDFGFGHVSGFLKLFSFIALIPTAIMISVIAYLYIGHRKRAAPPLSCMSMTARGFTVISTVFFLVVTGISFIIGGAMLGAVLLTGDTCSYFKHSVLTAQSKLKTLPRFDIKHMRESHMLDCIQESNASVFESNDYAALESLLEAVAESRIRLPLSAVEKLKKHVHRDLSIYHDVAKYLALYIHPDPTGRSGEPLPKEVIHSSLWPKTVKLSTDRFGDGGYLYGVESVVDYINKQIKDLVDQESPEHKNVWCIGETTGSGKLTDKCNISVTAHWECLLKDSENLDDKNNELNPNLKSTLKAMEKSKRKSFNDVICVAIDKAKLLSDTNAPCPRITASPPETSCLFKSYDPEMIPDDQPREDVSLYLIQTLDSFVSVPAETIRAIVAAVDAMYFSLADRANDLTLLIQNAGCRFLRQSFTNVYGNVCDEILPSLVYFIISWFILGVICVLCGFLSYRAWQYQSAMQEGQKVSDYYSPLERVVGGRGETSRATDQEYIFPLRGGLAEPAVLRSKEIANKGEKEYYLKRTDDKEDAGLWKFIKTKNNKVHRLPEGGQGIELKNQSTENETEGLLQGAVASGDESKITSNIPSQEDLNTEPLVRNRTGSKKKKSSK